MIETELYRLRFSKEEFEQQRAFWRPICRFLQRYVDPRGTTLDLGAGYCHFINQIESKTKIALDINEESLTRYANADVRCIAGAGSALDALPRASVDTVFASNVYEHFQTREDVAASFAEVHRVLREGGRFIILQPNFAYCYREYFDFFDHRLVFTRHGMEEGLALRRIQDGTGDRPFSSLHFKEPHSKGALDGFSLSERSAGVENPGRADAAGGQEVALRGVLTQQPECPDPSPSAAT